MLGRTYTVSGLGKSLSSTLLTSCGAAPSTWTVQNAGVHHHKERDDMSRYLGITRSNKAKANRNTHVNEKMFRKMRGRKTVLIDLPDDKDDSKTAGMTPQEMRIELLKRGVNPYKDAQPRVWNEAQITFQSIYGIADPYIPPENPIPLTSVGKEKLDEVKQRVQHKFYNWRMGASRIRKKEGFEKFDVKEFANKAEDIYIEAHKALQSRDKNGMHKFITEHAFAKMWPDVENGSVVFEFVKSLEPHKVVSVRCFENPPKSGNDIAQITVRMHSRQKLAIYDRFGRLLYGSEEEPKDVLEYVVFENHIAVVDGQWRLHGKIYPQWLEPKEGALQTKLLGPADEAVRSASAVSLPLRTTEKIEDEKKEKKENDE